MKNNKQLFTFPAKFIALILLLFLLGCSKSSEPDKDKEAEHHDDPGILKVDTEAQQKAGLKFATVTESEIRNLLHVNGKVVPDESQVVHIRPLASGRVEKLFVAPGSSVKAGQPLVTFDYVELGELESAYRKAQAEVEVRKQALNRAENLTKIGALAPSEYERRKADHENALADLAEIERKLARYGLRSADLKTLGQSGHSQLTQSILRSPTDGVLIKYEAAEGELVDPQLELFTIADLSSVWVEANVHETDLSLVEVRQEAEIKTDAYAGKIFSGKITKIGDMLDVATRTVRVRCEVPNHDRRLKLEMFVNVTLPTSKTRNALLVPTIAVQEIDHRPVLFVKQGEDHFEKRNIEIGQKTESGVEVVSGLKRGEVVVAEGSFSLKSEFLKAELGSDEHGH